MGNAAAFVLVGGHVPEPFFEELPHVEVVAAGFDEHLGVAGPALPLVPLGTVGGDVQIVVPLAPDHVFKQPVHHGVAAADAARPAQVGGHQHGGELPRFRRPGKCVQPDVAEAEEGQPGPVGLDPVPADVAQPGLGGAVVFIVEVAVPVQHLAVGEFHHVAGLRRHGKFHKARNLLPEIHHRLPLGGPEDPPGGNSVLGQDPLAFLGDQHVL